jgi:hypothetical protein
VVDYIGAVSFVGDHFDLSRRLQQRPNTAANERLIIGKAHPYHGAPSGTRAVI